MRTTDLFDLDHTVAAAYLSGFEHPWDAIKGISDFILKTGPQLDPSEYDMVAENVWVHKTATVFASASLTGPVIIGPNSHVYHCAIVRNGVLVGSDCVVGSSVEIKNMIMFDNAEICHFNFVGDSIVGHDVNIEAGAILCNHYNEREDDTVYVHVDRQRISTGLHKFGSLVGDGCRIGANAVLSPGTLLKPRTIVRRLELVEQDPS